MYSVATGEKELPGDLFKNLFWNIVIWGKKAIIEQNYV